MFCTLNLGLEEAQENHDTYGNRQEGTSLQEVMHGMYNVCFLLDMSTCKCLLDF
jgi:hypothetical protein